MGLKDVVVNRDSSGQIVGVIMGPEGRQALVTRLHGSVGHIKLDGHTVVLPGGQELGEGNASGNEGDQIVARTSALSSATGTICSGGAGSFCAKGESYNDHYTIFGLGYHHVGGYTATANSAMAYSESPAIKTCQQPPCTGCKFNINCVCACSYSCGPGDVVTYLTNSHGGQLTVPICRHYYGWVTATSSFFANVNGTVQNLGGFSSSSQSGYVSASLEAYGKLQFGSYPEADVSGACTWHDASGKGGSVLLPVTSAGSTVNCF